MHRVCGTIVACVTTYRISEAAELLGVSDDTVRRWVDSGVLAASDDDAGRSVIAGTDLAALAVERARTPDDPAAGSSSARNRLPGLVTGILSDTVMSQVELQAGPFRLVSLMSTEAVRELGLEVGSRAVAVVKATTVLVETPRAQR
ncbi:MerR family transcriptional regulator [Cellulomonas terrae]|uniref:MerR family transcriptional regulator n=1 Tax=Cellulomonas terrae TaxID=311234 RepID=A0A511JHV1_9CELL|nr:MerR family transcriptional regulator [Cellulomonas terrae]